MKKNNVIIPDFDRNNEQVLYGPPSAFRNIPSAQEKKVEKKKSKIWIIIGGILAVIVGFFVRSVFKMANQAAIYGPPEMMESYSGPSVYPSNLSFLGLLNVVFMPFVLLFGFASAFKKVDKKKKIIWIAILSLLTIAYVIGILTI